MRNAGKPGRIQSPLFLIKLKIYDTSNVLFGHDSPPATAAIRGSHNMETGVQLYVISSNKVSRGSELS